MGRTRWLVVAALVALFVVAGGILIYATGHKGAQNLTFNLTVTGGTTMSPSELSAHQGDSVTINITSDTAGEVHLHEYDIAFEVQPGRTVSRSFTADKTCSCDIEWEGTNHALGTLTVSP